MSMERRMANVYENKPNQNVLEKQREKYIQQEISWLLSDEGLQYLTNLEYSLREGSEESEDSGTTLSYEIIAKISNRLWEKNVGKNDQEEYKKFKTEFSDDVIGRQLIKEGIIDSEGNILLPGGHEEE